MSWRNDRRRVTLSDGRRLIGASFRGVPFFVESGERSGGRRVQVHEFPFREDPYVDDLGRRARVFPVEGYVLGADYLLDRDQLLGVLEDVEGPGELVHPYYGVRRAICSGLSVRESTAEGGMARFAIEFTETPAQSVAPTEQSDPADQVAIAADAAKAAAEAELIAAYDAEDLPSYAMTSAENALAELAEGMAAALAPLVRSTQELALLDARVRLLVAQAASLVRDPADALAAFQEVLDGLPETFTSAPSTVLWALIEAYATDAGPLAPAITANRLIEQANQIALAAALRRLLAIAAARIATTVAFESHDEAVEARDALADLLDEQAALASDEAYPALVRLRADLVRAVPGDAVLARIQTIERRVAIPSLLLAYQLYGSVENEADFLARNGVRHPAVIAGSLSVLTDE